MSKVSGGPTSTATNTARSQELRSTDKAENKDVATTTQAKTVDQAQKATLEKQPASIDDVKGARTRANAVDQAKQAELMQRLDKESGKTSAVTDAQKATTGITDKVNARPDTAKVAEADAVNAAYSPEELSYMKKEGIEIPEGAKADLPKTSAKDGDIAMGEHRTQELGKIDQTYGDKVNVDKEALAAKSKQNVYTSADPQIMEGIKAGGPGELSRGHKGPGVTETQSALNKFGFGLKEDGLLGPRSEAAVKQFQKASGLPETGAVDAATFKALNETDPATLKDKLKPADLPSGPTAITSAKMPSGERQEMIRNAILNDPQIPNSWASDPSKMAAINRIVEKESGWRVGIPNYTIRNAGMSGDQAAKLLQTNKNLTKFGAASSAMGLFQLLGTNMDKYQPGGRTTIGDAQSEMQGGLRYMADRYGDPERALAFHNRNNWW